MTKEVLTNCFYKILDQSDVLYFDVETDCTYHHFERVLKNSHCGRWKWTAFNKVGSQLKIDRFPRYYFFEESLTRELFEWLKLYGQSITKVDIPNNF